LGNLFEILHPCKLQYYRVFIFELNVNHDKYLYSLEISSTILVKTELLEWKLEEYHELFRPLSSDYLSFLENQIDISSYKHCYDLKDDLSKDRSFICDIRNVIFKKVIYYYYYYYYDRFTGIVLKNWFFSFIKIYVNRFMDSQWIFYYVYIAIISIRFFFFLEKSEIVLQPPLEASWESRLLLFNK